MPTRPGRSAFLFASGLIAAATLLPEQGRGGLGFRWRIALEQAHLFEDLLNAILFLPLGAAARELRLSLPRAFAVAVVVSTSVEVLQLTAIPGRFGELQDIISNTVGALVGWLIVGPPPDSP